MRAKTCKVCKAEYQQQDEADLWQEHFDAAMKEGKK